MTSQDPSKSRQRRHTPRPPKELLRILTSGRIPVWVVSAYVEGVGIAKETVSGKTREETIEQVRAVLRANGFRQQARPRLWRSACRTRTVLDPIRRLELIPSAPRRSRRSSNTKRGTCHWHLRVGAYRVRHDVVRRRPAVSSPASQRDLLRLNNSPFVLQPSAFESSKRVSADSALGRSKYLS